MTMQLEPAIRHIANIEDGNSAIERDGDLEPGPVVILYG